MEETNGCKVDVVAERYELTGGGFGAGSLDDQLVDRWTGADGRPAMGYKTLTEWFNKHLLGRVYDDHGRETIGTRLDSEYDALTGDDDLLREEVADDLRADGIDVHRVCEDMVSWSTMRHHLNDCLGAEKPTADATTNWERRSVDHARQIVETKTDDALRSLASKGELPGGDEAGVEVDVLLSCPDCPTRVKLVDALARGYVCEHLNPTRTDE